MKYCRRDFTWQDIAYLPLNKFRAAFKVRQNFFLYEKKILSNQNAFNNLSR